MTRSDFEKLLQRYTRGECTEEEKISMQIWFDKIESAPYFTLNEFERAITEEKLFADIENRINAGITEQEDEDEKPFRGRLNSYLIYGSVAASLILAVFMMRSDWTTMKYMLSQQLNVVENDDSNFIRKVNNTDKCQSVTFEDGSTVQLKPGSSVTYKTHFEGDKRVVTLKGNGFFDVTKNKKRPFYVLCGGTVTRVIGTSFWVHTDKKTKSVEVGVKTGRVSVIVNKDTKNREVNGGPKEVLLTPNQRVVFFEEKKKVEKMLVPEPLLLETPEVARMKFVYDEVPLSTVMEELGQSYGVQIRMSNDKLNSCTFTGDLTGMTFDEKFDLVCESVGTKYNIEGTSIILTGQGCK